MAEINSVSKDSNPARQLRILLLPEITKSILDIFHYLNKLFSFS